MAGYLGPMEQVAVLWLTAGLSCDGDSIAMTAATQPSLEDLVLGAFPGVPRVRFHHPVLAYEVGDEFLAGFEDAAAGKLDPFILVIEGSIPDETGNEEGCWAGFGTDPATGQPIPTTTWVDRLTAQAWAVMAVGTCAAYGGIHGMAGNPTGAMGLADYLGWDWRSRSGLPIVNLPGCPIQPDNCTETLLYLLRQLVGTAPPIPLDHVLRPTWLFGQTLHENCDRGGYYEQGDFAGEYGSSKCIVKLGCWGPVVDCNVGKRGWMNGIGGCANVGGTCIGCTMPGFPDKFQPFLDEPPGAKMSSSAVLLYGRSVRALRNVTRASMNVEPEWRGPLPKGLRPPAAPEG
ncbi:MAG: hydrogenase small subunit [Actinomycetota bacterium]|nr:hydrogenase small subunit [Actinomycetota bacterium]